MKYSIYQLNDRADSILRFSPFVIESRVHPENYDKVYEGNVESLPFAETRIGENASNREAILEYIFTVFNTARPENFKGHSLSISDIVCLQEGYFQEFFYVDSIGYKKLESFGDKIVTNIKWDTDGEYVKGLPKSVTIDPVVDDDDIADILSDRYGYCVFEFMIVRRENT